MALRRWMLANIPDHQTSFAPPSVENIREQSERLGISPEWLSFLQLQPSQVAALQRTTEAANLDRQSDVVYPPSELVHHWSRVCRPHDVKVVIVGQDPYHDGSGTGLAFATAKGRLPPPSLVTIFRELARSIPEFIAPVDGCLDAWCDRGVLLLNSVFTVLRGRPGSHDHLGWQLLSDHVLRTLSERHEGLVFMLWGVQAQRKDYLLDGTRHLILRSGHPSPRAQGAKTPFLGNHHFVLANEYLSRRGDHVDWTLPTPSKKRPRSPAV